MQDFCEAGGYNFRVDVPPGATAYRLRRVWLTAEEEAGYYSGFANEGLWPLCHIAHVRPTFRSSDFARYREVNAKFADAVVDEARTDAPIVLVQDYHFALLPRMIRERLPNATVVAFWHIPWPNPEAFAICPWRRELLDGLLGSSILGFHTQFHCNNFLDTVDRVLEARVDRETLTVSYQGKVTAVHVYPISIEWPPAAMATAGTVADARRVGRELVEAMVEPGLVQRVEDPQFRREVVVDVGHRHPGRAGNVRQGGARVPLRGEQIVGRREDRFANRLLLDLCHGCLQVGTRRSAEPGTTITSLRRLPASGES